jgi:hypothetical protein
MAASVQSGPFIVTGGQLYNTTLLSGVSPDLNQDAGPGLTYLGDSLPDFRFWWSGDYLSGRQGVAPAAYSAPFLTSVDQIPAAFGAAVLVAAATVTSGTAMTIKTTNATGFTTGIPIMPFNGVLNSAAVVTPACVLDFGFGFVTGTLNSTTWTVSDSRLFPVGMPLVIAAAGNAAGTAALLTWVTSQASSTTITTNDACVNSSGVTATPVGTGNIWNTREAQSTVYPTAAFPAVAVGPGLFFDPRQCVARGLSITCNNASGVGGVIKAVGYDVFGNPQTESITIAPGTSLVAYGKKAFKAITSLTPQFTDGTYTYSVGTSDVFGFMYRTDEWENTDVYWAGASMTANTGWTIADTTYAGQSSTTGDSRGTIQVSAQGGGSGIGTNNSNGTVSSLAMSGRRLMMAQSITLRNIITANPANPQPFYGQTPA